MNTEVPKPAIQTPFLISEVNRIKQEYAERSRRWEEEHSEVITSIPGLRKRLGALICKHTPFPEKIEEIDGKKVILIKPNDTANDTKYDKYDFVKTYSSFLALYTGEKRLSPIMLHCETTSEENLGVSIESSAYPFGNWRNKGKQRDVTFTVAISDLDYYIEFTEKGNAFVQGDSDTNERGKINLNQVKMLKEVLILLENPAITTYESEPRKFQK
ncbi:MAG: hypothetical protein A3H17_00685 [Candidatus Levybacteria bacterium RIFCSPLOWO2_12_FULL_37_14]|nr:MAG: hypothetical protein US55_C0039G0004 [Candidatus Levybacteria bacterium GW2011_GWC2_37_7]KKQ41538.1 MAG: hypothetical protein US59_C0028G0005 [Candidatus Levybacteria bacterium GW2011_GWB1_37_8]OGH51634.1 MAG: hypothetical protein A3H17_00685 [Candidatus Levybacteria bacterium RIFCSPLOWO2_12_FULL_37_14]